MPIKRHENGQMWKSDVRDRRKQLSRVVNEPIQSTPDITVNLKSGRHLVIVCCSWSFGHELIHYTSNNLVDR
ncbi:hypothetical protein M513_08041 [Trichuris suis]|uniref:Uncharacterized protein n=1 Tax=Trichuris suis TaxID=68888 RepID=A0A085M1P5_9BILA|nr:hypothetical protein M513_08041 [Trichuris suis]